MFYSTTRIRLRARRQTTSAYKVWYQRSLSLIARYGLLVLFFAGWQIASSA
ncbi:hypothetical protein [Kluyvera cryocrescens]|nr:hypothetical protein [Kluyvera cryocrescens]